MRLLKRHSLKHLESPSGDDEQHAAIGKLSGNRNAQLARSARVDQPPIEVPHDRTDQQTYGRQHTKPVNLHSGTAAVPPKRTRFTFWIDADQRSALKSIHVRDGISQAEQIRRALDFWIRSRGL